MEKESAVVKHDNIAALQRQSTPHQVGKDNHVLVSQEAVDVAAKVVSAPWVEAARRAFEISKAEQLDGVPVSAVAMQKHPAVDTFSEQQARAESAARETSSSSA